MKAMSKSELAAKAGVSRNTLMNWCKPYQKELEAMGLGPNAKVLPPNVVQFLANKLCLDV
ncbi:hypothetical protein [Prevotella sp. tc2-28]|uniref:hypothetical protein n=1 Tax=Prevotella sp. tc2-28 TaxID=1761888 RepID=UPI000B890975|nr:hypothetical protein [Prevotella sp. tc2-28]